ncbi:hypothetical protein TDB9533_03045 [Thalassocella blandensis]|nr:hypothetical protein TDB9533_03045 [Thalassocella blandensis]
MSTAFEGAMDKLAKYFNIPTDSNLQSPMELVLEGMTLTLYYSNASGEDDIVFSTSLGVISEQVELSVYRTILEGNLFWSATGDATIGVNSDTREAFLCYKMPLENFDGDELASLVVHFLQIGENWKVFIAESNQEDQSPSTVEINNDFLKV